MTKKKILHFITGLEIGGTEIQLLKIMPLLQNDFDNHICTLLTNGPVGERLKKKGIKVYHLNFSLKNFIGSIWYFRKILKNFKPDILITYLIHSDLFGRIFGRIFGVKKIICSQRGSLLNWKWLRFFDYLTKFLVTKYIVQTETAKKELIKKLYLPESKFEVIPNAIDLAEFDFQVNKEKKKKELGINNNNFNIVCVGKLRIGKGHEYLLTAFENIFLKNNKRMNLLLVGDGERKNELLQQIKNYKSNNNIYFLGNRTNVIEILKISDIFVLATEGEGMSNGILEAMAAEVPVITTDISENRELIEDQKTGLLFPVNDVMSLMDVIEKLIFDVDLRKKLSCNARQKTEKKFDIKTIIKLLSGFFENI